jgi:putative PIN family toxin of toxin-antitoxin system
VRVFLDTHVLVSSLTVRGLCSELLESIFNEHDLLVCEPVLQELKRILAEKFHLPAPLIRDYINLLKTESELVTAQAAVNIKLNDPDDVRILAFVIPAQPDVFVTGDKELLKRAEIEGIPILSPRRFWFRLSSGPE